MHLKFVIIIYSKLSTAEYVYIHFIIYDNEVLLLYLTFNHNFKWNM